MTQIQPSDSHSWHGNNNNSTSLHSQQQQHQNLEAQLIRHLESTGELTRIQNHLTAQLIKSGWRDEMKDRAKELIRQRGLTNITLDELVSELIPMGRTAVPNEVKGEVMDRLRQSVVNSDK